MSFSDDRAKVDQLLKELDAKLGSGVLQLDENGLCVLDIEEKGRIHIEVPEGSGLCYFAAPLAECPSEPERLAQLFTRLLTANYYGQGSKQATLSLDAENNVIYLHRGYETASLNVARLETAFETFQELVVAFKKRLATDFAEESETEAADEAVTTETVDPPPAQPNQAGGMSPMFGSFV